MSAFTQDYEAQYGRPGTVKNVLSSADLFLRIAASHARQRRAIATAIYETEFMSDDEVTRPLAAALRAKNRLRRECAFKAIWYTLKAVVMLRMGAPLT